jgi:putative tryptophan/tyrosine transport system substrate-binding protein
MDRREFISRVAFGLLTAPLVAEAQPVNPTPRVGNLYGRAISDYNKAFVDDLARLGFVSGRDIVIDDRPTDGTPEAFAEATTALLATKPDIIVVWGTVGAVAVKKATTALAVVFLSVGVPVEVGLVASLAHPGGNMTGVTFEAATETYAKRLQLLKEAVPHLSRAGVLYAAGDPNVHHAIQSLKGAAPALGIRLDLVEVRTSEGLEAAFSTIKARGAHGVVVVAGSFTFTNGKKIAELGVANRLPSSHAFKETVRAGGLLGLGPNYFDMAMQAAAYVAKILRGAKPADLPVEQPARMDLVINLKTAKALGLTIPPYTPPVRPES